MGYHVLCPGADLLNELSKDGEKLLGAPYPLYIIALATMIDDEALEWLLKYEMAFDSITGQCAAFMLFYNEANLKARGRGVVLFDYPFDYPSLMQSQVISLSGKSLRMGTNEVDKVICYDPNFKPSKEVLIRSMTYESDAVARELAVLDKLPCLLFIDEPRSSTYYLMALTKPEAGTLQELRQLLGDFMGDPEHAEYFDALRDWHNAVDKLKALRPQYENMRVEYQKVSRIDLRKFETDFAQARSLLFKGRAKEFRKKINEIEGSLYIGKTIFPWEILRKSSKQISHAKRLNDQIVEASERLGSPSSESEAEIETLLAKATNFLTRHGHLPNVTGPASISDIERELTSYVALKVEQTMELIYSSLGAPWKKKADDRYPWTDIEPSIETLEIALTRTTERLKQIRRPKISPHINKLQRRKKGSFIIKTVRRTVLDVSNKVPSIVDAISKGMQLIS